jgi:hypothetical protein
LCGFIAYGDEIKMLYAMRWGIETFSRKKDREYPSGNPVSFDHVQFLSICRFSLYNQELQEKTPLQDQFFSGCTYMP